MLGRVSARSHTCATTTKATCKTGLLFMVCFVAFPPPIFVSLCSLLSTPHPRWKPSHHRNNLQRLANPQMSCVLVGVASIALTALHRLHRHCDFSVADLRWAFVYKMWIIAGSVQINFCPVECVERLPYVVEWHSARKRSRWGIPREACWPLSASLLLPDSRGYRERWRRFREVFRCPATRPCARKQFLVIVWSSASTCFEIGH